MAGNLISNVINPEIGRVGGLPETAFLAKSEYTMAKRPGSLDNKTVYLVDTGFGGSARFMIQLQQWFTKNMPKVKTVRSENRAHPLWEAPLNCIKRSAKRVMPQYLV
jgi:hypothetical protein